MLSALPLFFLLSSQSPPAAPMKPTVKSVKLFYYDTVSRPAAKIYRELHVVGEDPWAKSPVFDVVVAVSGTANSVDEKVEVSIEELQEPTGLLLANKNVLGSNSIQRTTWVLHKVVYSGNSRFIKNNQLVMKEVPYQTAYNLTSGLYSKSAFRGSCFVYNQATKQLSRASKEIPYSE